MTPSLAKYIVSKDIFCDANVRNSIVGEAYCPWPCCPRPFRTWPHCRQCPLLAMSIVGGRIISNANYYQRAPSAAPSSAKPLSAPPLSVMPINCVPSIVCGPIFRGPIVRAPLSAALLSAMPLLATQIFRSSIIYKPIVGDPLLVMCIDRNATIRNKHRLWACICQRCCRRPHNLAIRIVYNPNCWWRCHRQCTSFISPTLVTPLSKIPII